MLLNSDPRTQWPRLKISDGRWGTLAFYVAFCLLVAFFLAATVHHRNLSILETDFGANRWKEVITFWVEKGYFRHGGLIFYTNKPHWYPESPEAVGTFCYAPYTGGHLMTAHLLQRISFLVTGSYNYRLMTWHNEGIVLLAAALLGLLAMRLSRHLGARPPHAVLLGAGCALAYQTFPYNLASYWETSAPLVGVLFSLIFLLTQERTLLRARVPRWTSMVTILAVFFMCYSEMLQSFFCLTTLLLATLVLGRGAVRWRRVAATIVLPACLSVAIYACQLVWVKYGLRNIPLLGHGLMFRTGFDGSTKYVGDHWSLLTQRGWIGASPMSWKWLFLCGSAAVLFVAIQFARYPRFRRPVLILAGALGLYVPMAFIFSQLLTIHPYHFDTLLVMPLMLALGALVPATLERWSRNKGIFTFMFLAMAICYTMVQIRTYAILFPM